MPNGGLFKFRLKGRGRHSISELHEYLKSKRSIVLIESHDNLCMARAIVVCRAALQLGTKSPKYKTIRTPDKGKGLYAVKSLQKRLALELTSQANVSPTKLAGLDEADKFQTVLAKENIQLNIFSFNHMNSIIYRGQTSDNSHLEKKIYIGYYKKHFCSIISMTGLFSTAYYCETCEFPYDSLIRHHCEFTCKNCLTRPACISDGNTDLKCSECNKTFDNLQCYGTHKLNNVCKKVKLCIYWGKYWQKYNNKEKIQSHTCGTYFCKVCSEFKSKGHQCYVTKLKPPNKSKYVDKHVILDDSDSADFESDTEDFTNDQTNHLNFFHIYFDIETAVVDGYFKPILCVAQKVCHKCHHLEIGDFCKFKCGRKQIIFGGEETRDDFCKWLFNPQHRGYTVISHNGGCFDILFVLGCMYDNLIYPKIVTRGSRILLMHVRDYQLRFIDSLNFMKTKLSDMPQMMGLLSVGEKGYFPYKALSRDFYDYVGKKLDLEMYSPGTMSRKEREFFLEWYNNLSDDYIFDFKKELIKYCKQDVNILRAGCLKFRQLLINYTGIDPFANCCTIASLTTHIWRKKYMPEKTVGVIPENNYMTRINTSHKAIGFMEYRMFQTGEKIRHSGRGGEVRVDGHYVDGLVVNTGEIIQFYGCMFHGCTVCYPRDIAHPFHKGLTMGEVFDKTVKTAKILKANHSVLEIWEHYYDNMLKHDKEFREFISNLDLEKHKYIDPRKALYGGRTECFRTHYTCGENESIEYVDSRSMYPRVLRDSKFPKGHPVLKHCLIDKDMGEVADYFGIAKVRILPPRQLYLPLLPYRSKKSNKLTFPNCAKCADLLQTKTCSHTEQERAIVGVYTTEEIKKALSLGYKILDFFKFGIMKIAVNITQTQANMAYLVNMLILFTN